MNTARHILSLNKFIDQILLSQALFYKNLLQIQLNAKDPNNQNTETIFAYV